ncbi:hypothetical protein HN51_029296 [Arachis hypogaea]
MFVGPAIAAGFKDMALTDENFQNTLVSDVVDKLISEWQTEPQKAIADSTGFIHFSLHHGEYDVTVTHPLGHSSKTLNLSVRKDSTQQTIHLCKRTIKVGSLTLLKIVGFGVVAKRMCYNNIEPSSNSALQISEKVHMIFSIYLYFLRRRHELAASASPTYLSD